MDERSQSHATWNRGYHLFFASKYRRKGATIIYAVWRGDDLFDRPVDERLGIKA